MSTTCDHCPCPGSCPAWEAFCGWAAEDPPDPVKLRHICGRAGAAARAAAGLALVAAMGACPFRSRGPGCGCAGANCALRKGAVVSHLDCFACLREYEGIGT